LTVSLRDVRGGDAALVRALVAARRPELAGLPDALLASQVEAQRREYGAAFPGAAEQVILRDGRPVGRLWIHRGEDAWRVLDVVVLPAERGAGVGTAVLTGLLDEADRAGAVVRLTVEAAAARRLYARLGFATVDRDALREVMERRPRARAGSPATD
jgi:GNAT superfamily N-acetyltransferase